MNKIRKQSYNLTVQDLEEYPAWEQALDEEGVEGQDEATVRPVSHNDAVDDSAIVRTEFTLNDGTVMFGYIAGGILEEDRTIMGLSPTIITKNGQVSFWRGWCKSDGEWLEKNYCLLAKKASEVFPIKFKSLYPIINGPINGAIDAFRGFEDLKTKKIWQHK